MDGDPGPHLLIQGENLSIDPSFIPVAVVNEKLADVLSSDEHEIRIQITADHNFSADNEVVLTVDPFAVLKVNVKSGAETI